MSELPERGPLVHLLKCEQPFYDQVVNGDKRFEYRENDRDFQLGDVVVLHEWLPEASVEGKSIPGAATGRMFGARITSIVHGPDKGVPEGFCIFQLEPYRGDTAVPMPDAYRGHFERGMLSVPKLDDRHTVPSCPDCNAAVQVSCKNCNALWEYEE